MNKKGAQLHLPYNNKPKQPITPRVFSGDVHFSRKDKDMNISVDHSPDQLDISKTYDNRSGGQQSPLDKFGKKMMKPEKSNITFGGNKNEK
jgi:hypothetical protein